MNPDRDRAVEMRRRALVDQIDGLDRMVVAGRGDPHVVVRLADTRAELVKLEAAAGP